MKALPAGLVACGIAGALLVASARSAHATVDMQKKAKAAGIAAANCLYCHNEKLPKKGASTNNDRGKWLVAEKEKRKAKEVDPVWLMECVEKKFPSI